MNNFGWPTRIRFQIIKMRQHWHYASPFLSCIIVLVYTWTIYAYMLSHKVGWHRKTLVPPFATFQGDTSFVHHCVIYVLCLSCFRLCLLLPCSHLLGKGWPLGFCLWRFIVFVTFPRGFMYLSGVVLDCIDSWSLPPFLLYWFKPANTNSTRVFVDLMTWRLWVLSC